MRVPSQDPLASPKEGEPHPQSLVGRENSAEPQPPAVAPKETAVPQEGHTMEESEQHNKEPQKSPNQVEESVGKKEVAPQLENSSPPTPPKKAKTVGDFKAAMAASQDAQKKTAKEKKEKEKERKEKEKADKEKKEKEKEKKETKGKDNKDSKTTPSSRKREKASSSILCIQY